MDSLDNIKILPRLSHPSESGRTFKLVWILDLVSDSYRSYVSLLFQNVDTHFVIVDTIPPELLAYCTVGSFFRNGIKMSSIPPDGQSMHLSINSTEDNVIVETHKAFSIKEYDLSLKGRNSRYAAASWHQLCIVQQTGDMRVIIPCFVIAATYYFRSTSLREAILSRKLESLFHECSIDHATRHAKIFLKPAGNICDAKFIARIKHDEFASQRLNLCKDHLYKDKDDTYKQLKVDFPVKQELSIIARGQYSENDDGGKTFVIFQIESEDSNFPFDSIDIEYEIADAPQGIEGTFPVRGSKHSNRFSHGSPSHGLIRQLLANCPPADNKHANEIKENRNPKVKSSSGEQRSPMLLEEENSTDLSSQPSSPNEESISGADIIQGEEKIHDRKFFNLYAFERLVATIKDHIEVVDGETKAEVTGYAYETGYVKSQHPANRLTRKESYDGSPLNLRKVAYVRFSFLDRHVCLVEIDQEGLPGKGCSTQVLISNNEIKADSAAFCVNAYVCGKLLRDRAKELGEGIILETKNHPPSDTESAYTSWRTILLAKIRHKSRIVSAR